MKLPMHDMPYFFLEDYFAFKGGAADNNTDCTEAIQAMFNNIQSFGGGVAVFPRGTCVQLSEATLVMGSNAGNVIIMGGGSAVRFGGNYWNAWGITSSEQVNIENISFIGAKRNFDFGNRGIYLSVDRRAIVRNCQFYGLAVSGSEMSSGVLSIAAGSALIEDCAFNGSAAINTSGVLNANACGLVQIKNCEFLDYQNNWRGGEDFIKSPLGVHAWVKIQDMQKLSGTSPRSVLIEGCRFDEAAAAAIRIDGAENVEVVRCSENIGSGGGSIYNDIRNLMVRQSWTGYASSGTPKKGVTISNVENVTYENVTYTDDIKWIHLVSGVKKIRLIDNELQGTSDYHDGVQNDAGAIKQLT